MLWIFIACKSVEPTPTDIDGLSHYFWQHYDDETPDSWLRGFEVHS